MAAEEPGTSGLLHQRWFQALIPLAVFAAALCAGMSYVGALRSEASAQARLILDERGARQMEAVQSILLGAQAPLFTLADMAAISKGETADFETVATRLLERNPQVAGLFLVPGGVVSAAVPLEGNEAAIGHDILKDPERRKEVEEAMATDSTVLAGPVAMRQGGEGLFARKPVFWEEDGKRRFWGLVVAMIRWDTLKRAMHLDALTAEGYAWTLSRRLASDREDTVISRSSEPVSPSASITHSFAIPGGRWNFVLSRAGSGAMAGQAAGPALALAGAAALALAISLLMRAMRANQVQAAELSRLNRQLTKRLEEREILVREAHHRVKNNLQMVLSLLSIQKAETRNEEFSNLADACKGRVEAIALAHEMLYKSDDLTHVDVCLYLERVAAHVLLGMGGGRSGISLRARGDDTAVAMAKAAPLGLIMAELTANACKHAFRGADDPAIHMDFKRLDDGSCILTVKDNGVGYAGPGCPKGETSLGFGLVRSLVKQLGGELACRGNDGLTVEMRFGPGLVEN
jgi:two-component sensor histidine kinase